MSCASRLEADEWCNAIANNVRALPAAKSKCNCACVYFVGSIKRSIFVRHS